ncbi:olfactory receptor 13C9-like [Xenopus tropicalis]|uniref:Olfactory receptor n=1 Tax=Xenopus tropicalis TaxID=8364 RepID=A0A8J0QMA7_XENTR|nr:olfactory receptor 13C9-like [Xenopus tropicalis]|eukprot:XP_002932805.2 PREDICTED: olfactory receptor 13C9-like [Xenopus tropicalis]
MIITGLVCLVSHLHSPMYFFLCNLAVQDIIYVSSILPKLMAITITDDTSISFSGCIRQMFMFIICVTTEFFLLTFMAYDRYVAICIPLRYLIIMNKRKCIQFAFLSWFFGLVNSAFYSIVMCTLPFCTMREINHFYCDLKAMAKLSCSDITLLETLMSLESVFLGLFPFALILVSYVCIICTIVKMRTSTGRAKTFSSCSSHLTVVIIFCGTVTSTYMKQESENSQELEKLMSLLYSTIVPVLNPLIYSLRNKDVLKAVMNIIKLKSNV